MRHSSQLEEDEENSTMHMVIDLNQSVATQRKAMSVM